MGIDEILTHYVFRHHDIRQRNLSHGLFYYGFRKMVRPSPKLRRKKKRRVNNDNDVPSCFCPVAQSTMIEQPCCTSSTQQGKASGHRLSTIIKTSSDQNATEPPGNQSDSKYLELLAGPSVTNTPDVHHLPSG